MIRSLPALLCATLMVIAFNAGLTSRQTAAPRADRQIVIVIDGLRPDYVTPEVMPRLYKLGRRGIVFTAHHSVFPTVTRVNASSFVTGAYPETHGLLGNTVYVPSADPNRVFDTALRENLEAIERADGHLLTAPTLGQILQRHGKKLLAVGSGTSGVAYLLDDPLGNGAVMHPEYALPAPLRAKIADAVGPSPAAAVPNSARHKYAVDAFLSVGLGEIQPDVAFVWLNDPDATAHAKGMGSPETNEALRFVDVQIGRIEDALDAKGWLARTNLIVTSDHGFSTHAGGLRLDGIVEPFAKTMSDGTRDITIAETAIHFHGQADPARVAALAAALQKRPEVGAIFTRPRPEGGTEGMVPGTLSFDVARWNHARSGDILISANWTRAANAASFAGTTTEGGVAGHGTSSPYDVHNTLIAAGPDFREHATSDRPTGNVDIAPTILRLMGIPAAPSMTGRAIEEALRDGPAPASLPISHDSLTVKTADGSYVLTAHVSTVAGHRYLDDTEVTRPK